MMASAITQTFALKPAKTAITFAQQVSQLSNQVCTLSSVVAEYSLKNSYLKLLEELYEWRLSPEQEALRTVVESCRQALQRLENTGPVPRTLKSRSELLHTQEASFAVIPAPQLWDEGWLDLLGSLTVGDWHRLLFDFYHNLSMLFMPATTWGTESQQFAHLMQTMQKAENVFFCCRILFPQQYAARLNYNIETGEKVECPGQDWFEGIVRSMRIPPETLQRCLWAHRRYQQRVAELDEEARQLQRELARALETREHGPASGWELGGVDECRELMTALERNTFDHFRLYQEHVFFVRRKVLSPLMVAELTLAVYPYIFTELPYVEAIMAMALEQEGQQQQLLLLPDTQGSAGGSCEAGSPGVTAAATASSSQEVSAQ